MLRPLALQLRATPVVQQCAPSSTTHPVSAAAIAGPSSRPWQPRLLTTGAAQSTPPNRISKVRRRHDISSRPRGDKEKPRVIMPLRLAKQSMDFLSSQTLLRALFSQLYTDDDKQPDSDQVWAAYYRIFQPEAVRQGVPLQLSFAHHSMVLRAVSPAWPAIRSMERAFREARRNGPKGDRIYTHYKDLHRLIRKGLLPGLPATKATSWHAYPERAVFVLARMREAQERGEGPGPSINDYNHVLRNAAEARDLSLADILWEQINEQGLCPQARTYLFMIKANSRSIVTTADSPWSVRQKLSEKELVGLRDPEVVSASRAAAARVVALANDMLHRGFQPNSSMLNYTLELLRLGGHYQSFELLLRVGFNIDLPRLEAQDQSLEASDRAQVSTSTLNSIILALGDRRTVSEMLAAFAILTQPSHSTADSDAAIPAGDHQPGAADAEPSALNRPPSTFALPSFQEFFQDLFYNDANALAKTDALHVDDIRVEAQSSTLTAIGPRPNSATYEGLITHCCGSAKGSGVLEAEAAAREKGAYRMVARYLLRDMLEGYRDAIGQLVPELGLREAETSVFEPASSFGQAIPTLLWPQICPKMQHFAPVFRLASHRRDVSLLTCLTEKVREAAGLMMKEELAVRFGMRLWQERFANNAQKKHLVNMLCEALSRRADYVATESGLLQSWSEKHLQPRLAALAAASNRRRDERQRRAEMEVEERARAARMRREIQGRKEATGVPQLASDDIAMAGGSSRFIHTSAGSLRGQRRVSPAAVPRTFWSCHSFRATFATSSRRPLASSSHPLVRKPNQHADAVIVGGGVVGLALACSLSKSESLVSSSSLAGFPYRLVLLEASNLNHLRSWAQQKEAKRHTSVSDANIDTEWENRVVSLTIENWHWLQDLGVTKYLVHNRIQPIVSMHISDGLSGAALNLGEASSADAASQASSDSPLSKMIELSNLQQAMLRFLDNDMSGVQLEIWDQTKVEDITPSQIGASSNTALEHVDAWPAVHTTSATSKESLRTRLLIGADGGSSPVRKYAGIDKYGWGYGCNGLVGTLSFDESESSRRGDQVAYQRFLPTGTIAWLPVRSGAKADLSAGFSDTAFLAPSPLQLSTNAASTVWTLPPDLASVMTTLHRSAPSDQPSVVADLITAAWRLPWASLSYILSLMKPHPNADDPASLDPSLLRQEIQGRLQAASRAGTLVPEEEVPPPVLNVAPRSVASFPLQVAHADAYLGSSLLSTASPSNSLLPANLLHSALSLAGLGGKSDVSAAKGRTVLVGDAAHSIHPLAGQGLNLGLRDARVLSEVIGAAASLGGDWGSHDSLKPYEQQTYLHNQIVLSAVDHLHWLYAGTPVPSSLDYQGGTQEDAQQSFARKLAKDAFGRSILWARSTGVEVLNELDWVKGKMQGFAGSKGDRSGGRRA